MKTIPLTKGKVALVDDADYEWLSQYKWCAQWHTCTRSYYAVRHTRGKEHGAGGKRYRVLMHRVILGLQRGDKRQGDHINGNTLDNRRFNLRIATPTQNQCNKRKQSNNTSGFKGVSQHRRSGRWQAIISINGKCIHLGYRFAAKQAYEELYVPAALKYHGEFARV